MAALAKHFRVVTMDLPGFGRSGEVSPEWFGLRANADAVLAVLDELDIERAAVLGYSWGGMTTLRFAAAHPEPDLGAGRRGGATPPDTARTIGPGCAPGHRSTCG